MSIGRCGRSLSPLHRKIDCTPTTLLDWIKRSEVDSGARPGGARLRAEEVNAYIDQHRDLYGGEPICKVLQVAPSNRESIRVARCTA